MAKKKKHVPVREKLNYKKPLKKCERAVDDIARVKKNAQERLRYRKNKLDSIPKPRGKSKKAKEKAKAYKKQTDLLRKEIKSYEREIKELKGTVAGIRDGCDLINDNKAKIRSLHSKRAARDRKLEKFYQSGKYNVEEYKKIQNEVLNLTKQIKAIKGKNADLVYAINKKLGFEPPEIAKELGFTKKELLDRHSEDFDEEYFEEFETEEEIEAEGEGIGMGPGAEPEEEGEPDERGYVTELDDVFWQVSQDFDKNEVNRLGGYDTIVISFDGKTYTFPGSSLSLATMKFKDMVRWCDEQSEKTSDSAVKIEKSVTLDRKKLKYYAYLIDG